MQLLRDRYGLERSGVSYARGNMTWLWIDGRAGLWVYANVSGTLLVPAADTASAP